MGVCEGPGRANSPAGPFSLQPAPGAGVCVQRKGGRCQGAGVMGTGGSAGDLDSGAEQPWATALASKQGLPFLFQVDAEGFESPLEAPALDFKETPVSWRPGLPWLFCTGRAGQLQGPGARHCGPREPGRQHLLC